MSIQPIHPAFKSCDQIFIRHTLFCSLLVGKAYKGFLYMCICNINFSVTYSIFVNMYMHMYRCHRLSMEFRLHDGVVKVPDDFTQLFLSIRKVKVITIISRILCNLVPGSPSLSRLHEKAGEPRR